MVNNDEKNKPEKKLVHKNIKNNKHTLSHSKDIVSRLELILYNQNKMLLRDIANRYKWNYSELRNALLEKPKK